MAINRRMAKQIVILYPYRGILLSGRKGETAGTFSKVSSSQNLYVEKESETQKNGCIYMTSENRQNCSDADKIQNSGSLWGCGITGCRGYFWGDRNKCSLLI